MVESTILEVSSPVERVDACVTILSAIADPVRWSVMQRLASGQACVCELQEIVPIAGNLLSYHLRILRDAGLVTSAQRGRWVDYALAPRVHELLAEAMPTSATITN
jgi:ArsR family transcriptional regulator